MEFNNIGGIESAMLERMQSHQTSIDNSVKTNGVESTNAHFEIAAPINSVLSVVNQQSQIASQKVTAIELGKSDDLIGATIANQKASLSFDMLMQVRNKMVSNFNDIFNMSI